MLSSVDSLLLFDDAELLFGKGLLLADFLQNLAQSILLAPASNNSLLTFCRASFGIDMVHLESRDKVKC